MRTVRDHMRVRATSGDVGIEIEVEGRNLPHTDEYWSVTHDGSLRGDEPDSALEYVLRRPMSLSKSFEALDYLGHQLTQKNVSVIDSGRCGVHVHVNVQKLTMVELYNFITLYLVLEPLLIKFCGDSREGNLFCLRAEDAEYLLHILALAAEEQVFREHFATDNLRYAAMNLKATAQYGSLEFRAMRGTTDMQLIKDWASILVGLREAAKNYHDPREIVMDMSAGGGEAFLRNNLGEYAELFLQYNDWEHSLLHGARLAQDVAYSGDWEEMTRVPKRKIGGIEVDGNWDEDWPPMDV